MVEMYVFENILKSSGQAKHHFPKTFADQLHKVVKFSLNFLSSAVGWHSKLYVTRSIYVQRE